MSRYNVGDFFTEGSSPPTDDEIAAAFAASMVTSSDRTAMDAFWAGEVVRLSTVLEN